MESTEQQRRRVISWEDPLHTLEKGKEMSGLAYLTAIQAGKLSSPPMAALIGMRIHEVSEGRVVFTAEPAEYHYNPVGSVHGGLAATLLDSAMGCSVLSLLPAGTIFTTLELKVNFLRPMTGQTGPVYCEGKIISAGKRIATAEGRVTDINGKIYAHATTTCMLLRS